MAKTFSYEFSTSGTPEEAEARLQRAISERLGHPTGDKSVSDHHYQMRLSQQTATSLSYKPKLAVFLPISFSIWVRRMLSGENVQIQFAPNGGDEQTRINVSGEVRSESQPIAGREFWTAILSSNG